MKLKLRIITCWIALMLISSNGYCQFAKMLRFTFNHYYAIDDLPNSSNKFINRNVDFQLKRDSIKVIIDENKFYFKRRSFRKKNKSGRNLGFYRPEPLYIRNGFNDYKLIEKSKIVDIEKDFIKCQGKIKTVLGNKTKIKTETFIIPIDELGGLVIGL